MLISHENPERRAGDRSHKKEKERSRSFPLLSHFFPDKNDEIEERVQAKKLEKRLKLREAKEEAAKEARKAAAGGGGGGGGGGGRRRKRDAADDTNKDGNPKRSGDHNPHGDAKDNPGSPKVNPGKGNPGKGNNPGKADGKGDNPAKAEESKKGGPQVDPKGNPTAEGHHAAINPTGKKQVPRHETKAAKKARRRARKKKERPPPPEAHVDNSHPPPKLRKQGTRHELVMADPHKPCEYSRSVPVVVPRMQCWCCWSPAQVFDIVSCPKTNLPILFLCPRPWSLPEPGRSRRVPRRGLGHPEGLADLPRARHPGRVRRPLRRPPGLPRRPRAQAGRRPRRARGVPSLRPQEVGRGSQQSLEKFGERRHFCQSIID